MGISTRLYKIDTIEAENTWIQMTVRASGSFEGGFNISIWGTINGSTVSLQRRMNNTEEWRTVDTFTEATEKTAYDPEGMQYRLGVATGNFSDGDSITVRLGQS